MYSLNARYSTHTISTTSFYYTAMNYKEKRTRVYMIKRISNVIIYVFVPAVLYVIILQFVFL